MPSSPPEQLRGILGKRVKYFYDIDGEKWEYNAYYQNDHRIVYSIRGGPMHGRKAQLSEGGVPAHPRGHLTVFTLPSHACIVAETGTVVATVVDLEEKQVHSMLAFSRGHWEHATEVHGDKRNPSDLERWRKLAFVGTNAPSERVFMTASAVIAQVEDGPGGPEEKLDEVRDEMPVF